MKYSFLVMVSALVFSSCGVSNKTTTSQNVEKLTSKCDQAIRYFINVPATGGSNEKIEATLELYPIEKKLRTISKNPNSNEIETEDISFEVSSCSLTDNYSKGREILILTTAAKPGKGKMIIEVIEEKITFKIGDADMDDDKLQNMGEVSKWEIIK